MANKSTKGKAGHVYLLTSPACGHIKIGGTDFAPLKRIREINSSEPYKSLGPWTLSDFRQVSDWRKVEHALHYTFRSKFVDTIPGQKELFAVSAVEVSRQLENIDEALVMKRPKVDRLFQDQEFSAFLVRLFRFTGIMNWLDFQGAWTFSLFPGTNGGRYYTLNIGTHEVAYATVARNGKHSVHMILMDHLIRDFTEVRSWVSKHSGGLEDDNYASGLYRSTSVFFEGDFDVAQEFLELNGVRRAIIAYWTEALMELQERGSTSIHSNNHNWNAVAELKRRMVLGLV